jgi:hypothetical protein
MDAGQKFYNSNSQMSSGSGEPPLKERRVCYNFEASVIDEFVECDDMRVGNIDRDATRIDTFTEILFGGIDNRKRKLFQAENYASSFQVNHSTRKTKIVPRMYL